MTRAYILLCVYASNLSNHSMLVYSASMYLSVHTLLAFLCVGACLCMHAYVYMLVLHNSGLLTLVVVYVITPTRIFIITRVAKYCI